MDETTLQNLRDAGCREVLIRELECLPSACARICRLKRYRRELLSRVHAEQSRLDTLDYLIHSMQNKENACQS